MIDKFFKNLSLTLQNIFIKNIFDKFLKDFDPIKMLVFFDCLFKK